MAKEETQTGPAMIGKMSVKNLGCTPVGSAEPKRLCLIYGRANGIKMGEDKGTGRIWSALTGGFEGLNLENGEVYRSGKLFLPGGIHEAIEAAVKTDDPEKFNEVKFGLEIRSVKASNPIGYSYQAVSLVNPTVADELDEMRALLAPANVKTIAAGEPSPNETPAPAPAAHSKKK